MLSYNLRYGWNVVAILARNVSSWDATWDSYFVVYDTGVNSVLAAGFGVLADLALAVIELFSFAFFL